MKKLSVILSVFLSIVLGILLIFMIGCGPNDDCEPDSSISYVNRSDAIQ